MPFSCIFRLNNGAIKKTDEIFFVEYVDASFDAFHEKPIIIAKALLNGNLVFIYSNCPCYVSSKGELKEGERISEDSKIGYFAANGEDIPCNKPYAIIKKQ
jgi:hypothetical protein